MKDKLRALASSPECAIRASSLPELMLCSWVWVVKHLAIETDESGQAADTGSAVHAAASAFHGDAKGNFADAIRAMKRRENEYPFADLESAGEQFLLYSKDPRNISARIEGNEKKVSFSLAPHETDKTQARIHIRGTLDQIRRINGRLALVDIKTGRDEGLVMLHNYAYQLAAYQLAASECMGELVHSAYILRTKDYLKKRAPGPVMWEATWKYTDLGRIMLSLRRRIAALRNGEIDPVSGNHCEYCPMGSIGNCVPRLIQLGGY